MPYTVISAAPCMMDADAVVNIRYASASIMQGAAEITVYGTAVRYK